MIFDNEKQRQILLALIDSVTISGKSLDEMYALKQQIHQGKIVKREPEKNEPPE